MLDKGQARAAADALLHQKAGARSGGPSARRWKLAAIFLGGGSLIGLILANALTARSFVELLVLALPVALLAVGLWQHR